MIPMLSLFECIARSSPLSLENIELIPITNWIFHVPHFLRSLMIWLVWSNSIKYFSIEIVLFLSPLF